MTDIRDVRGGSCVTNMNLQCLMTVKVNLFSVFTGVHQTSLTGSPDVEYILVFIKLIVNAVNHETAECFHRSHLFIWSTISVFMFFQLHFVFFSHHHHLTLSPKQNNLPLTILFIID